LNYFLCYFSNISAIKYRCRPVPSCPLSIPNILTTSTMSLPLLVVLSPLFLLLRRHLISISRSAASASRRVGASCPLLLPVASSFPAGCHVASCCAATSPHLLLCCRLTCPSSTPRLHLHRLVVASHLVALPPPAILSSTPPTLSVQPPHASRSPLVCPGWLPRCFMWHLRLTSASSPSPPPPPLVASRSHPP
jgi:hypothetical protein